MNWIAAARRKVCDVHVVALLIGAVLLVLLGWMPGAIRDAWRWPTSAAILICSLVLMHQASRLFQASRLSIPSFFYLSYIPMIYLPAFVVFNERPEPTRTIYLAAVQSVMLSIPLGVWFANVVARFTRAENDRFYERRLVVSSDTTPDFAVAILVAVIAVALTAVYFSELEFQRIPLIYMFRHPGDVDQLQYLREESFKLFDPRWNTASSSLIFYAFLFLRTLLFPFLITITLAYYLATRERRWLWMFAGATVVGGLYAAASIARAPLAALVMRCMFVYYLYRHGRMGRRATTFLIALMLAFPLLVTALAYGSIGITDALLRVAKRFTYTPADDLYVYFEVFPNHVAYQYGGTLLKPVLKLFELPYFYIENYVYLYQFPNGLTTGHANAAFLSNLHADFGPPGVVIGGFLVGILMQATQIRLARLPKTVTSVTVFAFMMYAFWVLNFGSITSVLGTNGVLPVVVLAWGFLALVGVAETLGDRGRRSRTAHAGTPS